MGTGAITQSVDVAQLVLYLFWIFFAGLIYYLVRENHREGYPMDVEGPRTNVITGWPVPQPKTYRLHDGTEVQKPDGLGPLTNFSAEPVHGYIGAPLVPVGDPLHAGIGPGAWTPRADVPDLDSDGHPVIRPLRDLPEHGVSPKDIDPRGLEVIGADGEVGGVVRDLWLDHAEMTFRFLEIETQGPDGPRHVLMPMGFARIGRDAVKVGAVLGSQFAQAPLTRQPNLVTKLEEEKIAGYYAAGTLYAKPDRADPFF